MRERLVRGASSGQARRLGSWAVALLLPLIQWAPAHAQFIAAKVGTDARSALLALHYAEGGWRPPCVEDAGLMRDSLFVRVHAGDSFAPERWLGGRGNSPGWFGITDVTPNGDVLVELPAGLLRDPENAARLDPEPLVVGRRPVTVETQPTSDGGAWFELMVVDSLPPGAELGVPTGPKPPGAWSRQAPTVVERRPAQVPYGYPGPWGTVRLTVFLDEYGDFDHAVVASGVSRALDAAAITSARHSKYALGIPCRGFLTKRSLDVEVGFAPRTR